MPSVKGSNPYALIIGAMGGMGIHFARMAAYSGHNLLLVDTNMQALDQAQAKLRQQFPNIHIQPISQGLIGENALGKQIFQSIEFVQLLQTERVRLDLMINLIEFEKDLDSFEGIWESGYPEKPLDVFTLLDLNQYFVSQTSDNPSYEILNVLVGPDGMNGLVWEMYRQTEGLLIEFAEYLNQHLYKRGGKVHALSHCGNGLVFHSPDVTVDAPPHQASNSMKFVHTLLEDFSRPQS